ncbi:amidohydrolase family protein [Rugosimonospora acidiphila]|uniref:Amidohydrolase family protein n=1 Tax=Rugosimonospora acidiphila TaxID=556531 RepID=A0ABP9SPV7_9ACTN
MQRIEATQLIPGRGSPVPDAVVLIDGEAISYAGPAAQAPPTPDAATVHAHTVMPGLWDCHTHLFGAYSLDLARLPVEPAPLRAARATADLRAALDAGVTTVREMGGLGVHLAKAVREGIVTGPDIYPAGAVLSPTGGHGDLHGYPLPWMLDYTGAGTEFRLADGPAECAKAAREQLRRDARVIKVCASGGVLSEVDHPIHQQFTGEELRAVVEMAGMADRVVAAHCHGKPGIMAALEAGVRTIEHGTYLDEECAVAMRETGAVLVPTRTIVVEIWESRSAPPWAQAKLDALIDQHTAAVSLAHELGVTVAMGTDLSLTAGDRPVSWGHNGRELGLLGECGFDALEAIEAATANGPATLGPQAPRSGQLIESYRADVLTLDADPLVDLGIFAEPAHITGVWKGGDRVKG